MPVQSDALASFESASKSSAVIKHYTGHMSKPNLMPPSFPVPPVATEEELQLFYSRVKASGVRPAIFMLLSHYCDMFEPPWNREPPVLQNLSCPEARSEDLPAFVSHSETFLAELQVSEEIVNYVESSTRMQSVSEMVCIPGWPHNSVGHEGCWLYKHLYRLSQLDQENLLSQQAEIPHFSNSMGIATRN